MTINDKIYTVEEIEIEWGKTFDEVAEILKDLQKFKSFGGWPNIRCKCEHIFGFKANEFQARAPFGDRPILQVQYQLAPVKKKFWQRLHVPLMAQLSKTLGNPYKIYKQYYQPDIKRKYMYGTVVYSAKWLIGEIEIGLSVYGDTRNEDSGPAVAGLYIDWKNEINAGKPYREKNNLTEYELGKYVSSNHEIRTYNLKLQQRFFRVTHDDLPDPYIAEKDMELRASQLALYKQHLFRTPLKISSRMTENEIALYFVSELNTWFVSNKWDTTPISAEEQKKIKFNKLLPARGAGGFELEINELVVKDSNDTIGTYEIVKDLEERLGIQIPVNETWDD